MQFHFPKRYRKMHTRYSDKNNILYTSYIYILIQIKNHKNYYNISISLIWIFNCPFKSFETNSDSSSENLNCLQILRKRGKKNRNRFKASSLYTPPTASHLMPDVISKQAAMVERIIGRHKCDASATF